MDYCDKVSLNLKDNPEWAAALAGASAGDTVTLKEVTLIIDEIASDIMVGSVDDCDGITVTPGPESKKDEENASQESEPVVSVMAAGYKK